MGTELLSHVLAPDHPMHKARPVLQLPVGLGESPRACEQGALHEQIYQKTSTHELAADGRAQLITGGSHFAVLPQKGFQPPGHLGLCHLPFHPPFTEFASETEGTSVAQTPPYM